MCLYEQQRCIQAELSAHFCLLPRKYTHLKFEHLNAALATFLFLSFYFVDMGLIARQD